MSWSLLVKLLVHKTSLQNVTQVRFIFKDSVILDLIVRRALGSARGWLKEDETPAHIYCEHVTAARHHEDTYRILREASSAIKAERNRLAGAVNINFMLN